MSSVNDAGPGPNGSLFAGTQTLNIAACQGRRESTCSGVPVCRSPMCASALTPSTNVAYVLIRCGRSLFHRRQKACSTLNIWTNHGGVPLADDLAY